MSGRPTISKLFAITLLAVMPAAVATATPLKAGAVKPSPRPNVILITIDTLRADHVGCYGAKNVKTPTLDALAADGVLFERAVSQVPLTWPSHAAILTGMYPFQNGVQDFTGQPLAPQFRSVAQAFKAAGYRTGAVVSAFVLDRSWGLERGFDFYDDAFSAETFQKKEIGLVDRRAEESVAHAIAWLKKNPPPQRAKTRPAGDPGVPQHPFFLWLHLYDPHSPYDPPEPYRTEYRGHLYDGEIAYADHELGKLMAWLKQNKIYDSSLIAMLSDHGESLGEHGEDEHGFFVYNATVHIPLIVKPPAGSGVQTGRRREPVQTTDVAPSLLQLARVKDPIQKQFQSASLFEASEAKQDAAYSETFYPFSSFGWSPLHALESDRFHYIDAPKPEMYDLEADPGETKNIAAEQPATVAVLKEKLQRLLAHNPFSRAHAGAANLSPDALEKLRALGYFGFRAAVPPEALAAALPDPKDKISEFNTILQSEDAFHRHEDDRAEALLLQVEQQDPKIYVIPFLLGESALRRQNWQQAADYLQRCLELNPNFDNAMTGLAYALAKLGEADAAKMWLDKAIANNGQNYRAWYQAGLLQAASNPSAAQAAYEKATVIQPNFAPGQRELGIALLQQKKYAAAVPHLQKAIALGLDDAHLHNYLGICYSRTNRLAEALKSYHTALQMDPNLAEAHLNLAFALQRMHRNGATEEYKAACKLDEKLCAFAPPN
jgi:choline-sulfatase